MRVPARARDSGSPPPYCLHESVGHADAPVRKALHAGVDPGADASFAGVYLLPAADETNYDGPPVVSVHRLDVDGEPCSALDQSSLNRVRLAAEMRDQFGANSDKELGLAGAPIEPRQHMRPGMRSQPTLTRPLVRRYLSDRHATTIAPIFYPVQRLFNNSAR